MPRKAGSGPHAVEVTNGHDHSRADQHADHDHHGPHKQTRSVLNRLSRTEGHIRGVRRMVEADNSSDAFVIACYSDPGLHACREGTTRPVFGIAECGVLTALARAGRFGVIAITRRSIARHMRYLLQMGLTDRLAGERPLEMSVAETASGERTLERMVDVGRQLKEKDGAEALVMGCAGMARHRRPLEQALGIPVIDPTQAAVTMALGAVQLNRP